MLYRSEDLRIKSTRVVLPPVFLEEEMPMSHQASLTVYEARSAITKILSGKDHRLLVVTRPCSIHDTKAAHEYAGVLKAAINEAAQDTANHADPRTIRLYARRKDLDTFGEIERRIAFE